MNIPKYSILLPTKNRPELCEWAVKSVLNQTYDNFELIITDNDDTNQTWKIIEPYCHDERIKYLRTGGLDMVQNWNAALNESVGDYILLLEDKMIFYKNALEIVDTCFLNNSEEVVVWSCDALEDERENIILKKQVSGLPYKEKSNDVLEKFLVKRQKVWGLLPRGLCCAISRRIVELSLKRFNGPFYDYFSPDLVSALKVLSVSHSIVYLNRALNVITSTKVSNGKKLTKGKGFQYYGKEASLKSVPIKNNTLVSNLIAEDIEVTLITNDGYSEMGNTPIWNRNKYIGGYKKALFREIAKGLHFVGWMRYSYKDLLEIVKFNGIEPRSYVELFVNYSKFKIRDLGLYRMLKGKKTKINTIQIKACDWQKTIERLLEAKI